jgi:hypothetical protein
LAGWLAGWLAGDLAPRPPHPSGWLAAGGLHPLRHPLQFSLAKKRAPLSSVPAMTNPAITAAAFLAAFNAAQAAYNNPATASERAALSAALDRSMADYRKAHRLSDACGFLDLISHYNATYATA